MESTPMVAVPDATGDCAPPRTASVPDVLGGNTIDREVLRLTSGGESSEEEVAPTPTATSTEPYSIPAVIRSEVAGVEMVSATPATSTDPISNLTVTRSEAVRCEIGSTPPATSTNPSSIFSQLPVRRLRQLKWVRPATKTATKCSASEVGRGGWRVLRGGGRLRLRWRACCSVCTHQLRKRG